jgi:hypothetical protein
VPKEARFPEVERAVPQPSEVATRLRLDAADARFLESALGRLPGAGDFNAPVTIEVNGKVAVRATSAEQPDQVTELVLSRSGYTGSQVCVCTDRVLLERALRLGFSEIGLAGVESPWVCRDGRRVYAVQPLGGGSPAPADAEVIRIESGTATDGERRAPAGTENTRRTTTLRESRNGREAAPPAEGPNRLSVRPAEAVATARSEQPPGTSLAALIQEAESLHAALADAKSCTARLVTGLRRQRKQSRLVQETLKSLRELKLQDVVA